MKLSFLICGLGMVFLSSCGDKKTAGEKMTIKETRTTGTLTMFVDETFGDIIQPQIDVFKMDYPDSKITVVFGNEGKIVPAFLNDSLRVIVMSRMLTSDEAKYYQQRRIPLKADRFAIDGIALITNKDNIDTNITVKEVVDILKGESKSAKQLVFDNPYSATVRYFKDLAKIKTLPPSGVSALNTNEDVIKFVAEHKGFIGVVGVNWLIDHNIMLSPEASGVMLMNVKNLLGQKGDDRYYKPIQSNLISGIYPFLRNVYIINAEGRDGLGTGFANWLVSRRAQLIVLKSGLGPHKMVPRELNIIKKN